MLHEQTFPTKDEIVKILCRYVGSIIASGVGSSEGLPI